jgi:hypothetical protein
MAVGPVYFRELIWNEPVLWHELKSPTGTVGRYLHVRGEAIRLAAMMQAGKRDGTLARSIFLQHESTTYGQKMTIGSNVRYAYYHHEGTMPHPIIAKGANVLRFSRGGRIIYSRNVLHPGSRPNKFLADNLPMILL